MHRSPEEVPPTVILIRDEAMNESQRAVFEQYGAIFTIGSRSITVTPEQHADVHAERYPRPLAAFLDSLQPGTYLFLIAPIRIEAARAWLYATLLGDDVRVRTVDDDQIVLEIPMDSLAQRSGEGVLYHLACGTLAYQFCAAADVSLDFVYTVVHLFLDEALRKLPAPSFGSIEMRVNREGETGAGDAAQLLSTALGMMGNASERLYAARLRNGSPMVRMDMRPFVRRDTSKDGFSAYLVTDAVVREILESGSLACELELAATVAILEALGLPVPFSEDAIDQASLVGNTN